MSDAERQSAMTALEESREKFANSVKGLSEKQWKFRAAEGKWSIADVAEHLALTEGGITSLVQQQLMQSPEVETVDTAWDQKMRPVLTDRSTKVQAPEPLRPSSNFATGDAAMDAFRGSRMKTISYVQNTKDDLRHHKAPHPFLGPLDGYQWLLLLSAHTERHTAQIEEVKTSAGYPASVK
ncbi:MAG: DinB family protein [Bryobacteraceae bacterium]|nr:DinB family protein [Bryobacteraceae bacterium]